MVLYGSFKSNYGRIQNGPAASGGGVDQQGEIMWRFNNSVKDFFDKVRKAAGLLGPGIEDGKQSVDAVGGKCLKPGSGGYHLQAHGGVNHGFKQNQRKERKLSRRRKMQTNAR